MPTTTGTFTYTRTFPTTSAGDTSDVLAGLVPTDPTTDNQERGIEVEFTPQADPSDPYTLYFPDVTQLRVSDGVVGTTQLKGFAKPGNRDSGGGGEVRQFAPLEGGGFSATGQLTAVGVDYAAGYGPADLLENPSGKIRLVFTPLNPQIPGVALWKTGWKVQLDLCKVLPTTSINYL